MEITLEQWKALIAVVDQGGFAAAAEALCKSQSTVSYAVQKIETRLGVRLFEQQGRRALLTEKGEAVARQARDLLERARLTEQLARQFGQGAEPRIRLTIEAIMPEGVIFAALERFARQQPQTRIEFRQSVLSGTEEALLRRKAELVISGRVPPGFYGEPLHRARFIAVAAPNHPLNQMARLATLEDLKFHRQIVVSDSGQRNLDVGWLGAEQRWTMDSLHLSITAVCRGLGFAWLPELKIHHLIQSGALQPLQLESGAVRYADLYLILSEGPFASHGVKELARLIHAEVKTADQSCPLGAD